MSAATMDRYLKKTRDAARPRGIATTRPAGEPLRNPITIRKAGDELDGLPGNVEADTVAHCGPSVRGEFRRTLTVVDIATGWTENASCRNNAFANLSRAEETIEGRLPFRIRSYDTDNGSEFINRGLIAWLQERDIEQTRSRPYRKNDQATVESRNNHVVRRHAFYYRYTIDELDLLNELWELARVKVNLFTPSRKPVGGTSTRDGRPRRVYDALRTPWERLKEFDERDRAAGGPGFILPGRREEIERIIATTNPAELVRRIHAVQDRLEALAAPRTARLARRVGPDMAYLNKTLARIAGVEPEDDETPQADEDQDLALTTGEAPLRISRSFSNEAPRNSARRPNVRLSPRSVVEMGHGVIRFLLGEPASVFTCQLVPDRFGGHGHVFLIAFGLCKRIGVPIGFHVVDGVLCGLRAELSSVFTCQLIVDSLLGQVKILGIGTGLTERGTVFRGNLRLLFLLFFLFGLRRAGVLRLGSVRR